MAKVAAVPTAVETVAPVHFMKKSHTLVSKRHIDLEKLDVFESLSITAVFVLAVLVGVSTSINIA